MVVCEVCSKPITDALYTSEMIVCDRCHTHYHLVLTKNEKKNLLILLNMLRDIVAKKHAPNTIELVNTLVERLTRD